VSASIEGARTSRRPTDQRDAGRSTSSHRRSARPRLLLVAALATTALVSLGAASIGSAQLPNDRAYEMVSPVEKNAVNPGAGIPSSDGTRVNFEAIGACCGAPTAAVTLFQSRRSAAGWETTVLTPAPPSPLVGLLQEQAPMDWTSDLTQTIWVTPAAYDPADTDDERLDLYVSSADGGTPVWLSQGSVGGSDHVQATLGGATPDFSHVVFTSKEALTPDAESQPLTGQDAAYLYMRDVNAGTTTLINVDDAGNLISTDGAILGNAAFIDQQYIPANFTGTSRNAVSNDGTKVFFQSPPGGFTSGPAHLYMRDLSTNTTTPLDDPNAATGAQYEGASENGSLVFFTSSQGLDGAPTDKELYGFDTTTGTRFRVSAGETGDATGDVIGETAISNDGSHVFFVAKGVLASNQNSQGQTATLGEPNFYDYNTSAGTTTFITTVARPDVFNCGFGSCSESLTVGLADQPDVNRPAVPTPDGSVLLFGSTGNLTGEAPGGPTTTLTADALSGDSTLTVASTDGLIAGRTITVGSDPFKEAARISRVVDDTHIRLAGSFGGVIFQHDAGDPVEQTQPGEIYRYETGSGALVCVSCPPPGFEAAGDAGFGTVSGGAYGPTGVPMSADGSRIFFNSPGPLVSEDVNGDTPPSGPFGVRGTNDVYQWENGTVSLISDGRSPGSSLGSTTPSGDDVLFTTNGRLASPDEDGFSDIYDARVGGGFAEPPPPPPPCTGDDCKPPPTPPPPEEQPGTVSFHGQGNFEVAAITAQQAKRFAKTGSLTLDTTVPKAGKVTAKVRAKLHGNKLTTVDEASRQARSAGHVRLTVHLSKAAKGALDSNGSLAVRIRVSFRGAAQIAALDLRSAR
jgi:hypothetical protein